MLSRAPMRTSALDLTTMFAPVANCSAIGLAVSGGVDSLALMALARQWAQDQINPPQLIVYTLDHGLRAAAADEVALVIRCAEALGLGVRALTWDGPKPETGVQAAARQARYSLIGSAMADDGAEVLLTAHHRGDQAETLLMRMAHGSGLTGLGGIRAEALVEGVKVFRPLLEVDKARLQTVVAENGWRAVVDPSNEDLHYERVRWRQMMPQLAQLGLGSETLAGLGRRLRRADQALSALTETVFGNIGQIDPFGVVRLDVAEFLTAQEEIQVRLVQQAVVIAGDRRKPFALAQVEQLTTDLRTEEFAPATLSGCKISRHADMLVFAREAGRVATKAQQIAPARKLVWDARFEIANRGNVPVHVQPARTLAKKQIADILGHDDIRMADIGGAPAVIDEAGRILAVGTRVFDGAITSEFTTEHGVKVRNC